MGRKKKEIPTFRQCVESRYQHDLAMNGPATFIVVMMPLLVLLLVYIMGQTDTMYGVMADYLDKAIVVCLSVEMYIILIVVYKLYMRLCTHSTRDKVWMLSLIDYASSKGANVEKLKSCLKDMKFREAFVGRVVAIALFAAMFTFMVWVMLYNVPVIQSFTGGNEVFALIVDEQVIFEMDIVFVSIGIAAILLTVMMIFIFLPVIRYPYKHEQRQVVFTRHLANAMAEKGINIMPMTPVVKKMHLITNLIGFLFFYFIWFFYISVKIFRNMNNHLMNEWEYEEELLKAIESDGADGFKGGLYAQIKSNRSRKKQMSSRKFAKRMRSKVRSDNALPLILVIAELFLIVLCGNYVLKVIAIDCLMSDNLDVYRPTFENFMDIPASSWVNIALVIMDLYFVMAMIDSILGLGSRKASSWRKVVRSCVTFVIPLWISAFITRSTGISHLFDFNVYITTAILYDVLLLMIVSYEIRRYYTPAGHEMPPIRTWIRYAIFGSLVTGAAATLDEEITDIDIDHQF